VEWVERDVSALNVPARTTSVVRYNRPQVEAAVHDSRRTWDAGIVSGETPTMASSADHEIRVVSVGEPLREMDQMSGTDLSSLGVRDVAFRTASIFPRMDTPSARCSWYTTALRQWTCEGREHLTLQFQLGECIFEILQASM